MSSTRFLPFLALFAIAGCAASSGSDDPRSDESELIASCVSGVPTATVTCDVASRDGLHHATLTATTSPIVQNPRSSKICSPSSATEDFATLHVTSASGSAEDPLSMVVHASTAQPLASLRRGAARVDELPFVFAPREVHGAFTLVSDAAGAVHLESNVVETTAEGTVSYEGKFGCSTH